MLSRSAQGLYWMGRYIERTERLCCLLQAQADALVDSPIRDIYAGWRRMYGSLRREPPGGLSRADSDDLTLADSFTLAGDLTFERSNPDSLWSCFAQTRENARQMRHLITSEMWLRLNLAYLRIRNLAIEDIWTKQPESFYAGVVAETDAFNGAAATTMYRDEGWLFFQLGRDVERAQLNPAILLEQLAIDAEEGDEAPQDWASLLRAFHATEAYARRKGAIVQSNAALDLLVADPLLPNSLMQSVQQTKSALEALGPGAGADSGAAAVRAAGRLAAAIQYDWADGADRPNLLQRAGDQSRDMHFLITSAYFDYPV